MSKKKKRVLQKPKRARNLPKLNKDLLEMKPLSKGEKEVRFK